MFRLQHSRVSQICEQLKEAKNARNKKLERRAKELRTLLYANECNNALRIVCLRWSSVWNAINLVFVNGLIVWLFYESCDLKRLRFISFDKHLIGKLVSEHIVDFVFVDESFIFVSYTDPKITAIFTSADKAYKTFKLKRRTQFQLNEFDISCNSPRRVERHIVLNADQSLFLVWWQNGSNLISPWSAPDSSHSDLLNLFVYDYIDFKFNLISFASIINDILKVGNQLTISTYETNVSSESETLKHIDTIRVPIATKCLKVDFNTIGDKLVILCEDKTVTIFHMEFYLIFSFCPSINAVNIVCSPLDSFFIICDHFGQILIYDYSLNVIPANYDDLLLNETSEGLASIEFLNGRLICLKFVENEDYVLVNLPFSIDFLTLICEYVKHDYINEAISNLRVLNWNRNSNLIYTSINMVFNHLLKQPLNAAREIQIEEILAIYFNPNHPVNCDVIAFYKLEMYYLAKRFFYFLLRYCCFEKAFLLALDLNSHPLFLLLHKLAKERGFNKLSEVALSKAQKLCDNIQKKEMLNDKGNASKVSHSLTPVSQFVKESNNNFCNEANYKCESSEKGYDVTALCTLESGIYSCERVQTNELYSFPNRKLFSHTKSFEVVDDEESCTLLKSSGEQVDFIASLPMPQGAFMSSNKNADVLDYSLGDQKTNTAPALPPRYGSSTSNPPPLPPRKCQQSEDSYHCGRKEMVGMVCDEMNVPLSKINSVECSKVTNLGVPSDSCSSSMLPR
ncbi:WD repeat-containing and planar cell polarity effector protein fritz-like isoform X1 [Dinothrombium tinctorium]|uniref:WD repeat-containing and planar cell polarity effector protein fritz-like isoform X1 n=1 Tax=Dinothrombium tinctorium TaxID=1965070 RepID=A0A3S3RZ08_9ACAR|nr:WD repeat-containing and planar cell polarity effector protein fritz-like isoform X1 [Dinothrombium tinctorium]RWS08115.1 WD repeat-containing and planar cell polarity effector protein fritz-like isoform X1 [Dinothrombium tinctorium]